MANGVLGRSAPERAEVVATTARGSMPRHRAADINVNQAGSLRRVLLLTVQRMQWLRCGVPGKFVTSHVAVVHKSVCARAF